MKEEAEVTTLLVITSTAPNALRAAEIYSTRDSQVACNSSNLDTERAQLSDASIEIKAYSQGLKKVEAQLVAHQQGQLWYEQKIKFMKIDLDDKTDVVTTQTRSGE
ncbi:hypothetical protein Tco_1145546 [Tanacetum coccineum]